MTGDEIEAIWHETLRALSRPPAANIPGQLAAFPPTPDTDTPEPRHTGKETSRRHLPSPTKGTT